MSTTKSCERSIVQSVKRKDRRIMNYSTALLILFDKVRQWFLSWNLPSTASKDDMRHMAEDAFRAIQTQHEDALGDSWDELGFARFTPRSLI
ncbi:hypothetical protein N7453_004274 [Penicillium expansum]|nr:hypothetical protein N7453_004274 [Penicillium expansum]